MHFKEHKGSVLVRGACGLSRLRDLLRLAVRFNIGDSNCGAATAIELQRDYDFDVHNERYAQSPQSTVSCHRFGPRTPYSGLFK